ncbi:CHAT domain-containing protein [Gimesia maris]|uniref:CHAT domain protein n=1 Tax=Gimesia maris TaxID=122 RepID=A0ABX5YRN9_9PLAN|nr:CHAT domain-containing protein [Gimesia maris]EDL59245.1 hypothetical protein PM8797T_23399 [Gimesia maris DSM 8797]QEG18217.1 CHAT domain protein [Gimesia maris]QGQ28782.1 CHAT domain-containing protein [Gimesia maris]
MNTLNIVPVFWKQRISNQLDSLPQESRVIHNIYLDALEHLNDCVVRLIDRSENPAKVRYALSCSEESDFLQSFLWSENTFTPDFAIRQAIECDDIPTRLILLACSLSSPEMSLPANSEKGLRIATECAWLLAAMGEYCIAFNFLRKSIDACCHLDQTGIRVEINVKNSVAVALATGFESLYLLCRLGIDTLQPEHALVSIEQFLGFSKEALQQRLYGHDPIQYLSDIFGQAPNDGLARFLVLYSKCLTQCNQGDLANRFLLASVGLYPSDFNGMHAIETQIEAILADEGGDPTSSKVKTRYSGNVSSSNWLLAGKRLGVRNSMFPSTKSKNIFEKVGLAIKGDITRRSKACLDPPSLSDEDRIDFCFALSSTFISVGRPLVALDVCAGSLFRQGVSENVPDELRGADESELFSAALATLFSNDRLRQLKLGAHLVGILQGYRGHQKGRKLLLNLLGLADLEGKRHPRDRIRQSLDEIVLISPELIVVITDQLRMALEASCLRGSARLVLEEAISTLLELKVPKSPYLNFHFVRLSAHSKFMTGNSGECVEMIEKSLGSLRTPGTSRRSQHHAHGQSIQHPVFAKHLDLLANAYRDCGRLEDAYRMQLNLLWQSSESQADNTLRWAAMSNSRFARLETTRNKDSYEFESDRWFGPLATTRICHLITEVASSLHADDLSDDAFYVLQLLQHKNADLSDTSQGIRFIQFPLVARAIVNENSYIPWLRFAQIYATVVEQLGLVDDAAKLLESFMNLNQSYSLKEYPQTWWLSELQTPERIEHLLTWLMLSQKTSDPDRLRICDEVVKEVQELSELDIRGYSNRIEFWKQLQRLRSTALTIGLSEIKEPGAGISYTVPALCCKVSYWLEQLDNRIILEQAILLDAAVTKRTSNHVSLENTWTDLPIKMDNDAWSVVLEAAQDTYDGWLENLKGYSFDNAAMKSGSVTTHIQSKESEAEEKIEAIEEQYVDIDDLVTERYSELLSFVSSGSSIPALLHDNSTWIRAAFDNAGRLFWWGLFKPPGENQLKFLGIHISDTDAKEVINDVNLETDACIEAIWHVVNINRKSQSSFSSLPPDTAYQDPQWHSIQERISEALNHKNSSDADFLKPGDIKALKIPFPRILNLLRAIRDEFFSDNGNSDNRLLRLYAAWKQCYEYLSQDGDDSSIMQWKDKSLNNVCSRQLAVCSYFFDLSELENHIESTSQLKMLFSVEGPLHSVPLSWLSYRGRPIFEEADATNVAISLTLHRHQRMRETSKMNRPSVFCGLWEQPGQRKSFGFPILWRGVQRWSEKNGNGRHEQVCYGCCDDPLLTPKNLISATHSKKCDIFILAGHGVDGKFGIEFSGGQSHSPASLWRGEGDFSNCSLIVLLSCSVGRLRHSSITDVQGLYTRILANGGGNVVAAKWDVDDCYGASFLLEFLDEYALINRRNETLGVAFNNARKKAWKRYLSQLSSKEVEKAKCHHAIAAFDYFGYA